MNIIGAPNVGKSTLLNALLGERLVIATPKAQTTRHRILGILNGDDHQLVLSDTPGILEPQYPLQASMMKAVDEALKDADVLLVMVEHGQLPDRAEGVLQRARRFKGPMLVLVNKIDLGDQEGVAAMLGAWHEALPESLADIGRGGMKDPWGNDYVYLNLTTIKGKGKARKDHSLVPLNSDYDLYSKGPDGASVAPLTAAASHDDILRANNGRFIGPASSY